MCITFVRIAPATPPEYIRVINRKGIAMSTRILLLLAFVVASPASADSYKCRGPKGEVVISDTGCYGNTSTESVRSSEYISPERARQAREASTRNQAQLQGIENENAAYRQAQKIKAAQVQAQPVAQATAPAPITDSDAYRNCVRDVERQPASQSVKAEMIAACRTSGLVQRSSGISGDAVTNCVRDVERTAASGKEKARQLATCHGGDVKPEPPPPPKPQPSTITSCDRGGCWDNVGNRYNSGGGNTMFRNDGKTCQKVGNTLNCN